MVGCGFVGVLWWDCWVGWYFFGDWKLVMWLLVYFVYDWEGKCVLVICDLWLGIFWICFVG